MLSSIEVALKEWLLPGSLPFLLIAVGAGVALLYAGDAWRRWGRRWLTAIAVLYWMLATPLCANLLVAAVSRPDWLGSVPSVPAIVVLSNGVDPYTARGETLVVLRAESAFNVLEGARLYRLAAPRFVVASGGIVDASVQRTPEARVLRDALVQLGVPLDRIVEEDSSRDTREQAVNVAVILRQRQVSRFILVTAPQHMPRALGAFHETGIEPIPSASAYHSTEPLRWTMLLPSGSALESSKWAVYEFLGREYYWIRGWWR